MPDFPVYPTTKKLNIPRAAFEDSGWRTIELARGSVEFPDGRHCRFNVRLVAMPGANGDIQLFAEDINRDCAPTVITLKRKK